MITLSKLKLTNFLSHKLTEITFQENQKLLIDGTSGSGKSSIVEGLVWALYGKGRVENRNLIRRGAKNAIVTLELADDKRIYQIERNYDITGKHTLNVSEKKGKVLTPIKSIGLKDSQAWIEKELLKCSYTLFINSVAYPQDNIENFVKQTAAKRKEMLLEIANTENYDEYYDKAKSMLFDMARETLKNELFLENCQKEIERNKEIAEKSTQWEELRQTHEITVKKLKEEKAKAEKEIDYIKELKSQINHNLVKMDSLKFKILNDKDYVEKNKNKIKELNNYDEKVIARRKEERNALLLSIGNLEADLEFDYELKLRRNSLMMNKPLVSDLSANLERLNGQLLNIQMAGNAYCEYINKDCPKLEQELKNKSKFIEEQINDLQEREKNQQEILRNYSKEIEALPLDKTTEADQVRFKELKKKLEDYRDLDGLDTIKVEKEKMMAELKKEIDETKISLITSENDLEKLILNSEGLKKEFFSLKAASLETIQTDLDIAIGGLIEAKMKGEQAQEAKKNIQENILKLLEGNEARKELKAKTESLELIKEAFGSRGIKIVVIDYLIPRLEYRINEILSKMSDFKIRLETQKEKLSSEGNTEGLFINIYNEAGEQFDFGNYSGSEKLRVSYSIFEGLASLQKCCFKIFDEMVNGLDPENESKFVDLIIELKESATKQLICISHLKSVQDVFEEKITIVKKEGVSSIMSKMQEDHKAKKSPFEILQ